MIRTMTISNGVKYLDDVEQAAGTEGFSTFGNTDATPAVNLGKYYKTGTSTLTITDFDSPEGQAKHIIVYVQAVITLTHDATKIDCIDDTDLVMGVGDIFEALYNGTVWYVWLVRNAVA